MTTAEHIRAFSNYNEELLSLFQNIASGNSVNNSVVINASYIEQKIRSLIPIHSLRDAGTFFTGDDLAEKLISQFSSQINDNSRILDPSCGTGNLLLACTKRLPIYNTLHETLRCWGKVLKGVDLYPEFVKATKLRLILEALQRGAIYKNERISDLEKLLPYIKQGDGLECKNFNSKLTHIIMNPPYNNVESNVFWSSGKVNNAGIFLYKITSLLSENTEIAGVFPDVIRSGSRYYKLRKYVDSQLTIKCLISGKFNAKTNVDIFLLHGKKTNALIANNWYPLHSNENTVGDFFNVYTGPLVPFRHKEEGKLSPYIHPKNIKVWGTNKRCNEKIRFSGTLHTPPFVVCKRTSAPKHQFRASSSLIMWKTPTAVENHLLVLKPKNDDAKICFQLMDLLMSEEVNKFLNNRIRCRHLTVSAVKEIPWEVELDER